jgi:hypothetical protein
MKMKPAAEAILPLAFLCNRLTIIDESAPTTDELQSSSAIEKKLQP